ncbi:MAG TPA: cellulase family glycosylhydrolase [Pedobacter sp.]|jgi:aryl-phospho-beta-D-glucosidase BglC (GH1 family)
MMKFKLLLFAIPLIVIICLSFVKGGSQIDKAGILRRKGNLITDTKGKEVWLKGVSFGNEVWSDKMLPVNHHTEKDFKRVSLMGMNVVRFYLNYKTLENDQKPYTYKQEGWDWIDKNIAWAKKNNVYLILNIHVPQGGFQSNGEGMALWDNLENQKRLKALWYNIAKRYAKEPGVAGYDLVNEPVVSKSIGQWESLAQQLADTIRKADKAHVLIVERLNAIKQSYKNVNEDMNLFLINDPNTMYTFHFYSPFKFTHQYSRSTMGDGGKYPDETIEEGEGQVRNKVYLETELNKYLAFGKKHNVPLYLGEFGIIKHGFEAGKGGERWVSDMVDLLKKNHVNFTYHVYHEDLFGLYYGYGKPIDTTQANFSLIEVFRKKLKSK